MKDDPRVISETQFNYHINTAMRLNIPRRLLCDVISFDVYVILSNHQFAGCAAINHENDRTVNQKLETKNR